ERQRMVCNNELNQLRPFVQVLGREHNYRRLKRSQHDRNCHDYPRSKGRLPELDQRKSWSQHFLVQKLPLVKTYPACQIRTEQSQNNQNLPELSHPSYKVTCPQTIVLNS